MLAANQIKEIKSLESQDIIRMINIDSAGLIDNGIYQRLKRQIEADDRRKSAKVGSRNKSQALWNTEIDSKAPSSAL